MSKNKKASKVDFSTVDLEVIIPVYSNFEQLGATLAAIRQADFPYKMSITLVDDYSPDLETVGKPFYDEQKKLGAKVLYNPRNLGFPKTVNNGVKRADGKHILILNSDVVLAPDALKIMYEHLISVSEVGMVVPKLLFFPNSDGRGGRPAGKVQHCGIVFDIRGNPYHRYSGWSADHPFVNQVCNLNAATGACMMMARKLFMEIGGFDERFGRGCLVGDSMVFSNRGLSNIESLMGDEKLNDHDIMISSTDGNRFSNLSFRNGKSDVYKLVTQKGFEIRATPDHKIYVLGKTGIPEWKEISKLSKDDYVGIKYGMELWGENSLSDDESYLLGLFTAEGNVDGNRICITTADLPIREFLIGLGFRDSKNYHYRLGDIERIKRWENYGIDFSLKASQKSIPEYILKSNRETVKSYLSGLFDGDGCAKKDGKITLASSSYKLLQQTQLLLLNFGIIATITNKHKDKFNKKMPNGKIYTCNPSWTLELSHGSDIFYSQIGFRLERKQKRHTFWNGKNSYDIPYQRNRLKNLYNTITKYGNKNYQINSKLVNGPSPATTNLSVISLLKNLPNLQDNEDYKVLQDLVARNIVWLKVKDVFPDGNEETFDIHVPETHAYVANGIIVHNTFEDVSLCFDLRLKNYNIRYLPQAVGFHYSGMSAERTGEGFPVQENSIRFHQKYMGKIPYDEQLLTGLE